ncbi:MAG: diacylglycerol kinase [Candidatus Moraniibacteriota bacterium]
MRTFIRSFRHALAGLLYALKTERNFQIEFVVAVVIFILMLIFPLTFPERALLVAMTAIVLSLELMNTSFERMLDMLKPHVHPYVKVIKDLVAGAVLIASLAAFIVGLLIFLPHLRGLF